MLAGVEKRKWVRSRREDLVLAFGSIVVLTPDQVLRVAAAGQIPKEEWPRLEHVLKHYLAIFRQLKAVEGTQETKKRKLIKLGRIECAARRLKLMLDELWVEREMVECDLEARTELNERASRSHIDDLIAAVGEIADRAKTTRKWCAASPESMREHVAAVKGHSKIEITALLHYMCKYWTKNLRRRAIIQQASPYVAFAQEVLRLAEVDTGKWSTLRDRLLQVEKLQTEKSRPVERW